MAVKGDTKKIAMAALSALCAVLSHLGAMAADAVAATDSDTQTLTISGNGAMADYASQDWAPWHEHLKASITNVVIESGVENVGDCAFYDEPLIDISFDLAGNPVIKTPKVVNTTGFAYRVESARDPAFSRIVGSKSLGSGSVTFDKSDEPRFFRLTATAR